MKLRVKFRQRQKQKKYSKPPDSTHEVVLSAPQPHQPADENLNSRRGTKDAGQACVPRKKYEMPRGAINLPRKKQGRASHSLSVGEPGAGFIFFKRNICLTRHQHNLKARHAPRRKRDSCKYKSTQGKP